ncbi:F-box only protein 48 isoform X4 [Carcharodon carcharias]|uniref:F-box only protein 48 isoform X4 n=1 Tax=Carcharodon carcharias TaxID=13397 RepID=UPI001B7F4701|nr:F-box only protein 48 isoform X4 [Carcharodon carcharias]
MQSELDIRSLSNAAMTCKVWNDLIENSDSLWYNHCLTILAVCKRELQCDRASGHSWKVTLVRNYKKSNIKRAWLLHHDADCKTHFPGRNSRKLQDRKKRRPFILHTLPRGQHGEEVRPLACWKDLTGRAFLITSQATLIGVIHQQGLQHQVGLDARLYQTLVEEKHLRI